MAWRIEEGEVPFNANGILTCCKRTVMGLPSEPGDVRGRPPLCNLDQLTAFHAMVLEGAVRRGRVRGSGNADSRCG
jgi:hypothetical protein